MHHNPSISVDDNDSFDVQQFESCLPIFSEVKSVILCGIEAQACILQTVLDLIERDFDVHVVADAVSARSMVDRLVTFEEFHSIFFYTASY